MDTAREETMTPFEQGYHRTMKLAQVDHPYNADNPYVVRMSYKPRLRDQITHRGAGALSGGALGGSLGSLIATAMDDRDLTAPLTAGGIGLGALTGGLLNAPPTLPDDVLQAEDPYALASALEASPDEQYKRVAEAIRADLDRRAQEGAWEQGT